MLSLVLHIFSWHLDSSVIRFENNKNDSVSGVMIDVMFLFRDQYLHSCMTEEGYFGLIYLKWRLSNVFFRQTSTSFKSETKLYHWVWSRWDSNSQPSDLQQSPKIIYWSSYQILHPSYIFSCDILTNDPSGIIKCIVSLHPALCHVCFALIYHPIEHIYQDYWWNVIQEFVIGFRVVSLNQLSICFVYLAFYAT